MKDNLLLTGTSCLEYALKRENEGGRPYTEELRGGFSDKETEEKQR